MNILELPKDILLEIWSYISEFADAFRFGQTCKSIKTGLHKSRKSIFLSAIHPPEVWQDVLSHADRHQLRKLHVVHSAQTKDEYFLQTAEAMTVLSSLNGLRWLQISFYNVSADSSNGMQLIDLSKIFKKMTWLEYLDVGMPLQDNIGELFKDCTRLTTLKIGSTNKGIGYAKLTQLKELGVSVYTGDDVLNQVLELTQLTSLDISWSEISQENAMQLSKLTNLETIWLAGVDFSYRKFLSSLPKLRALQDETPEEDEYDILSSLTMLTSLDLAHNNMPMRIITTLTELKYLDIDGFIGDSPNLSELIKLKTLRISSTQDIDHIQLPHGLKILALRFTLAKPFKESILEDICNADSIEQLAIDWRLSNPPTAISRLTNLHQLRFSNEMPKDLCQHLTNLSTLRTIILSVISEHAVNELQVLTQLCSLQFSTVELDKQRPSMTLQEIRRKLPFIVYKS